MGIIRMDKKRETRPSRQRKRKNKGKAKGKGGKKMRKTNNVKEEKIRDGN